MMKSNREKKLTACITLALLLQFGTGYAAVQGASIEAVNKNDGTGDQPQTVSALINVNDSSSTNADKTYFGVYSTGQNTQTQVVLTGQQSITLSGDTNTAYKAYGIYNEKGAQTAWQVDTSGAAINMAATAYIADAYGIYDTGDHSHVSVRSNEGNGLAIQVTGHSAADDSASSLPSYPPTGNVIGVWGDAGAVNTISAQSIQATGQSEYQFNRNGTQLYDQDVLTQLNAAIDTAADAYAAVLDQYDTYADEQSYLNDLNQAQSAVDTAIAAYDAIAGGVNTVGIYGDTAAQNTITVAGPVTVSNTMQVSQTTASDISQSTLVLQNIAAGIYGNNGAQNSVAVGEGINVSATSNISESHNENTSGTNQTDHAVYTLEAIGIYGANGSKNDITTPSDIAVSGSGYMNRYETISDGVTNTTHANLLHVAGVYGNNESQNIVQAGNIAADLQSWYGYAAVQGTVASDVTINTRNTGSINITGIEGNNSANNQISAEAISAQIQYASIQDNISMSADSGNNNAAGAVSVVSGTAVNVRGVSGDSSALNQITSDDISAQIGNFTASINDNVSSNGGSVAMNVGHMYSVPVNVQGIYGNNNAVNYVESGNISAQLGNFTASIGDSTYDYDGEQSADNSIINARGVYNVPINVQGVYGDNMSLNQVTATAVSAQVQSVNIMSYLNADIVNASDEHSFTYDLPITVQGVYGGNDAVNIITADTISADVGGSGSLTINGNYNVTPSENGGVVSITGAVPIIVAGVYGNTGAVNTITTNEIMATSSLFQQNIYDTNGERVTIPSSVHVFGIYGAGQSVINLHSKDPNGTVGISVGASQNTSGGGSADISNVNTYGVYLDHGAINFYDNVNVSGQAVAANSTASALDIVPITYLKNADITFAGYNDYYDAYYYNANTETYGKNMAGSGTFHTYASDTGTLDLQGSNTFTVNTDLAHNESDMLSFAALSNESTGTNYVSVAADASVLQNSKGTINGKTVVIAIADAENALTAKGNQFIFDNAAGDSENVSFEGKTISENGVLRKYEITPTVETEDTGSSKNVIITAIQYDTSGPSDGLKGTSDVQLAMRNLGLVENATLMQRMGELRQELPVEDGIWAKFNKGRLEADSAYGGTFDQDYNQFSLGYDTQRNYHNGKLYTGAAVSHVYGDIDYEKGTGTAKSTAVSLYGTWLGDKGHYLDIIGKAGRLSNQFSVSETDADNVSADYSTPAYSLSAEYGYRKKMQKGYFVEPQVQLLLGRIQGVDYHLSSGASIHQGDINSAVGRLGVLGGKSFANGSNAYIKASVLKDFGGSGSVIGYYGTDSLAVDTEKYGTWLELGVGANIKVSADYNLYFDVLKTFGGNVVQKWQVNVGSRWKF
ncbi:autotransporter outer membrane beta-barrel domain-containing protein [Megasphaera cerevisiae]|uniref:autotransporter outer membrane beta-barrel domain-containing protein n=1 Tax=Megasphaera cerevisiae TaxID=39029 RepID=UPI0009421BCE|nr:autotransporter outer membrane beta-barrel domain-containing protein [Megasphaera cerevisiae]OKY52409.1 hypothetical protein BSR42_13015 [Megasphaera cerevisiae]